MAGCQPLVGRSPAQWYALWTRSRHEHVVHRELDLRHVEVFLPVVWRWTATNHRRRRSEFPLFPGYCFARFDLFDRFRVLNCAGVASIVSIAGEPAPIPDSDIEGIQRLVESDFRYDAFPLLPEGRRVEVVRGPLVGIVGRLVRKGTHDVLVLSVEQVGGAVSVQVHAADVAAV